MVHFCIGLVAVVFSLLSLDGMRHGYMISYGMFAMWVSVALANFAIAFIDRPRQAPRVKGRHLPY